MDRVIDSRFERVETALSKLIGSISAYNPSAALAASLVDADTELSQGLDQLSIHQANHARLISLRSTSAALDLQIKETLTLLTDTRRALLDTPSTTFPDTKNQVSYSDLLSYARRISKFTLPTTYREAEAPTDSAEVTGNTPKEAKPESQTNGSSTPVTTTAGADKGAPLGGSPMDIDSAPSIATQSQSQTQTQPLSQPTVITDVSLPQDFSQFLNPLADVPFIPWPTEDVMRRGALASIQVLLDSNIDPATFDPAQSAALEAERQRLAEEADRAREEQNARVDEERREAENATGRRESAAPVREPERPSVFQLETFDDDDSE